MAWQQQPGGYDNYGGYVDTSYAQNDQQNQQYYGSPATGMPHGSQQTGAADQAAYDMFSSGDESMNFHQDPNVPGNNVPNASQYSGAPPMSNAGYYNNVNVPHSTPHSQPHQTYGGSQQPPDFASMAGGMFGGGAEHLISNPMVAGIANQQFEKGREEIKKNLDKYISIGQLKYYFAVDTNYVGKKLGLLLFPFAQKDWSIKYNQEEPVQPKYDVNAPDLYIPCMGYITYILVIGYILGLRNTFSPDNLAATASSSLVWMILELVVIYLTLTVMSINTSLTKWDILSFSCYKYVGMIVVLLIGLCLNSSLAYYISLAYVSAALVFFLLRTLKLRIEPEVHGMEMHGKKKLYMMLLYAGLQPILIWLLTSYYVPLSTLTQYNNVLSDTPPVPTA